MYSGAELLYISEPHAARGIIRFDLMSPRWAPRFCKRERTAFKVFAECIPLTVEHDPVKRRDRVRAVSAPSHPEPSETRTDQVARGMRPLLVLLSEVVVERAEQARSSSTVAGPGLRDAGVRRGQVLQHVHGPTAARGLRTLEVKATIVPSSSGS